MRKYNCYQKCMIVLMHLRLRLMMMTEVHPNRMNVVICIELDACYANKSLLGCDVILW